MTPGKPKDIASLSSCQLLTIKQAAGLLSISPHTLRGWISRHQVEVVRLGRAVRLREAEVRRIIEEHRQPPASIWRGRP